MDDQEEMIRQQMQQTRESLSEKLETLEQQVVQTVQGATTAVSETVESVKEAVQGTVETVKGSVQDTVESVKSTFDLGRHVQEHPWFMVGGATAAGFLAGRLMGSLGLFNGRATAAPPPSRGGYREEPPRAPRAAAVSQAAPAPAWTQQVTHLFGDEIRQLKGLALGTLFGVVRDLVTQAVPQQLESQVKSLFNNVTTKLGGEPVREPLVHPHNGRRGCDM
jgi:ElaB/YqjD/DUF883 family membrane-anchored ribosome-binding protein